jgi:asparagine synthase (glutamine-hydrolysing)
MCGIAGVLHLDGRPASPVEVRRMTEAIAHRGPDAAGQWVSESVGLGHRRLAVIDLTKAGNQPMVSADGRHVLVFNGEIYNFRELRDELSKQGRGFVSRTDTEVLLQAFSAWGADCVQRLNGMFAFAVWDCLSGTLTLGRDRYGIKPLYYARQGGCLFFASEVKAILAHSAARGELDEEALVEYFTFQNFLSERTLYEGVRMLPAGTFLQVAAARPAAQPLVYWDFAFREPAGRADAPEYAEELQRLLRQAVSRQLVADVEIGAYLSGGIDSGSITALAARELPLVRTFTVGFDLTSASGLELAADERRQAEHMSYLFRTEHYEMVLKAGDMERCHPDLVRHMEEPRVGQSYPNWYAARLASRFVKVALSGTGGDELFGGYPWRYRAAFGDGGFDGFVDRYFRFWNRLVPDSDLRQLFAPIWCRVAQVDTREVMARILRNGRAAGGRREDYLNRALYFEAKTFLHGLLVVEDKLGMAHGLETRLPFLDNALVDFAQQVPIRLKLRGLAPRAPIDENDPTRPEKFEQKTNDGKLLLRRALNRLVPSHVRNRVKQGFTAPDASWYKGESIDFVRSRILTPKALIYNFMDRKTVVSLVNDHIEGRINRRLFIWSLLSFEEWLDQFLDRRRG